MRRHPRPATIVEVFDEGQQLGFTTMPLILPHSIQHSNTRDHTPSPLAQPATAHMCTPTHPSPASHSSRHTHTPQPSQTCAHPPQPRQPHLICAQPSRQPQLTCALYFAQTLNAHHSPASPTHPPLCSKTVRRQLCDPVLFTSGGPTSLVLARTGWLVGGTGFVNSSTEYHSIANLLSIPVRPTPTTPRGQSRIGQSKIATQAGTRNFPGKIVKRDENGHTEGAAGRQLGRP